METFGIVEEITGMLEVVGTDTFEVAGNGNMFFVCWDDTFFFLFVDIIINRNRKEFAQSLIAIFIPIDCID